MSVNLTKGAKVNLTKGNAGLSKMLVGLGWDVQEYTGPAFDLDAVAFLLDANGKCAKSEDFIYFNNLKSTDGSVEHTGDNLTGEGDGDDESILIDLNRVPTAVERIVIAITIFSADSENNQCFGQVTNAFIRLVDNVKNEELFKLDLSEDHSTEVSVIAGELYRHNGEWKFQATDAGFIGDLEKLTNEYGV